MVPTENVRAALAAVESGNVDAGFVYKTDADILEKSEDRVQRSDSKKARRFAIRSHIVKEAKNKSAAENFLALFGIGRTRENYSSDTDSL